MVCFNWALINFMFYTLYRFFRDLVIPLIDIWCICHGFSTRCLWPQVSGFLQSVCYVFCSISQFPGGVECFDLISLIWGDCEQFCLFWCIMVGCEDCVILYIPFWKIGYNTIHDEVGLGQFSWTPLIFVCFSIYMLHCISFVDFCSYYGYWFVFARVYVYSC